MVVVQPIQARPFLKWAGGKTQLLGELTQRLPRAVRETGTIKSYIEPFVGGGAFYFHLWNDFEIESACLMDINKELIVGYKVVQREPEDLVAALRRIESDYLALDEEGRKTFYYGIRDQYNRQIKTFDREIFGSEWIIRASHLIFLNKTCFNGLFRQNRRGEFNVPHGRYSKPTICDAPGISAANKALAGVTLLCDDFLKSDEYIAPGSFVYFDPPYRPLSRTASFTGYHRGDFDDGDQMRLARYFGRLSTRGADLMLSNSDPKASDPQDEFFDDLYSDFNIQRVFAKRSINCNGHGRGAVTELVIRNY